MRTLTKSVFGAPGRSNMSALALVTLASAIAALALVILALSPTAAQSAERHNGNTIPLSGKTLLKIDKGTAAALSDAGVKVEATGAAVGPTAKRPAFAFPIVAGKVDKDPLGGQIVHSGGLSFSADSKSVVVKRFVIDLDRFVLTAKVAGTGQRIALLSALARNYGDVYWDHAASAIDGCCPWIFASTASRSARVNFHSKGRAILS